MAKRNAINWEVDMSATTFETSLDIIAHETVSYALIPLWNNAKIILRAGIEEAGVHEVIVAEFPSALPQLADDLTIRIGWVHMGGKYRIRATVSAGEWKPNVYFTLSELIELLKPVAFNYFGGV